MILLELYQQMISRCMGYSVYTSKRFVKGIADWPLYELGNVVFIIILFLAPLVVMNIDFTLYAHIIMASMGALMYCCIQWK